MVDTDNILRENRRLTQTVQLQTQEVQRHRDRFTALNQVAKTISQSLDLDETLDTALQVVVDICEAEAGGISLIDEKTDEVVLRAQLNWSHDFVNNPMRIGAGEGMSGEVIENNRVLVIQDLNDTNKLAVPSFRQEGFRSLAMAPMHARGKIIGILSIMSAKPHSFDDATIDILRTVADTVGVALDNARLYSQSIENQNRLSAILQSTADGIIATDDSGTVRMMNPSAERMLNVQANDTIGLPLRDAPIPNSLIDPLRLALMSRDESPQKSFQVTLPKERVLMVFVSPVWDSDPTLPQETHDGWVIVLQDVTHLRRAEEVKAQFIQAAAHDMRNPLGVTMTSLGTLQSLVDDDLMQEVIDVALSGVNRMQRLLDDLLHLERIESGYVFNMDTIDITELIYEAVAQIRPLADARQQQLNITIQNGLGTIDADAHWISRALTNYLSNANKYSPNGSTITLNAFQKAGFVHIEVSDNGRGIPLEVQQRLFERFYRVKETASQERGSGLGLAIVKSVVEAHGGGVYINSRVGEGSTFGMALPTHQT